MSTLIETSSLRVGKISFLNTLPFFHGWEARGGGLAFFEGVPSEINERLRRGEIDTAIASSFLYALHPQDFLILPGYCIGSEGPSRSVILFSKCPAERLDGKKIALSSKSLSAATLLKVLLKLRWGLENSFEESPLPAPEMLKRHDAALMIGDDALFYRAPDIYSYDLSEVWREWTGLPFCFALWTVRKSFFERNPQKVRAFSALLGAHLRRNLNRLPEAAAQYVLGALEKELVIEYLQSLKYRLEEPLVRGLERFYRLAAQCGLTEREAALNFCPGETGDTTDDHC
ncbi:MAG: menaquinone biosynthesis protein [Candidatus Omnitrophica bacterium]|nr:menaquinone biosynthesis protein [Candidatus Omnitrophota bacterium]